MIDAHCHLVAHEFAQDREQVIHRAKEAGISAIITIADTLEEADAGIALAQIHQGVVFATAGVHPHHASSLKKEDAEQLKKLADQPEVKAIGEIGLDYHYNFSEPSKQRAVFEIQLQLAHELNLPVVLHTREAIEDTWNIVATIRPQSLVLHCCTEAFADVKRFLDAGYFLSFTGIAPYPKSEAVRETIRQCPMEQLMIETDAPYLPPEALRAKGGRAV